MTHGCAYLIHKGTLAFMVLSCSCEHPNGKGEKSMRTESSCFLDQPDILLDEIKGAEGYQGDTASGGTSHPKKQWRQRRLCPIRLQQGKLGTCPWTLQCLT